MPTTTPSRRRGEGSPAEAAGRLIAATADPVQRRINAPAPYRFPDADADFVAWSFARGELEDARYYWLATVSPRHRPYLTPLWGVWIDDALYLDGAPTTRWARNLLSNPHVAVHVGDGNDVVIFDGVADDFMADRELGERIIGAWSTKYGRSMPDPIDDGVFRVRPLAARAWSRETLDDGSAWDFAEPG